MIILDTTTRSLEIDLNAAVATNQLPFVASYVDVNQSTFAMSAMSTNTGASNSTTAVTLVAAPGATTSRQLKYLSIKNSDTAAVLLWVQLNDNTTLREIWKGTLAVGDTLVYVDTLGFNVLDSSGGIKNSLVNTLSTLTLTSTLTMSGTAANIALGANFISYGGTDAGFSLDASNNATFSANLAAVIGTFTRASAGDSVLFTNGGATPKTGYLYSDAALVGMFGAASASGAGFYINPGTSATMASPNQATTLVLTNGTAAITATSTTLSGNLTVSGTGPHAIGGAGNANWQLHLGGTNTGTTNPIALVINSTLNPAANNQGTIAYFAGTINEAGSGTHSDFTTLYLDPPTIGAGAGALTNASTLKITGAPTGATNNYTLWVDAGSFRLDGTDGAGVAAGTLLTAPSAGNPDKWIPINSEGTQYWVPAWAA